MNRKSWFQVNDSWLYKTNNSRPTFQTQQNMRASILIVDDESQIRTLLTKMLQHAGYSCQDVENVRAAKLLLDQQHFELILTDMNMPGESGADLARYVTKHYPHTGVVMVTVIDSPDQAKEILEIGVYGYIVKPFSRNLVLITVDNALRRLHLEVKENDYKRELEQKVVDQFHDLKTSLILTESLIETIPIPVYYKGLDGRYQGCNHSFAYFSGHTKDQIIGKTVRDLQTPEMAQIISEKDSKILTDGKSQAYEQKLLSQDGNVHTGIIHKAAFRDEGGKIAGLIGVWLDITEIRENEKALLKSEEKLRSIMNNLQIGVIMLSPDFVVLETNQKISQWFPQVEDATGKLCHQILVDNASQSKCPNCPAKEVLATGDISEATFKRKTMHGERMLRVVASPIFNSKGHISAVLELIEDVTDSYQAEQDLRQAQKLEAVGQLAAGIAHEINTPIQYVGDNLNFLKTAFDDMLALQNVNIDIMQSLKSMEGSASSIAKLESAMEEADVDFLIEEVPKTIQQSMEGVSRVAKIVQAMREFSHPGTNEKTLVDINQALRTTLTISRNEWKYVANVETDFSEDLPSLQCLPGEMNQVFLNLIVNAAHAIGDINDSGNKGKGLISLSTRIHEKSMEIRIKDTGGGIPDEVQNRVFDPFFTTKKIGKGTGQGLSIARNVVVDKHQGTLDFESTKGQGTTFIIKLPLSTTTHSQEH